MGTGLGGRSIIILGAGKSGTSGLYASVKQGLENAIGRPIRMFFELYDLSVLDEYRKRPLLVKMLLERVMLIDRSQLRRFDKRVLIVRDPRDVLVSRLMWQLVGFPGFRTRANIDRAIEIFRRKEADPQSISLSELYRTLGEIGENPTWLESAHKLSYLPLRMSDDEIASMHCVRYEDYVEDRLDDLADYLGFQPVPRAVPPPPNDVTFRAASHGDWRRWFTPEDDDHFNTGSGTNLRALGYAVEPFEPSTQPLPAEKGSDYVLQHFRKRLPELFT